MCWWKWLKKSFDILTTLVALYMCIAFLCRGAADTCAVNGTGVAVEQP